MSNEGNWKTSGYSGKFLQSISSAPSEELTQIDNKKLLEIYETIIKMEIYQQEDMVWAEGGGSFSLPIYYISKYKFGMNDSKIEIFLEKMKKINLELSSSVIFNGRERLICSYVKATQILDKRDWLKALDLVQGFNLGNRFCVMRIEIEDNIAFYIQTHLEMESENEKIAELCYIQGCLVMLFLQYISSKKLEELNGDEVFSFIRNQLETESFRLSFSGDESSKLETINKLKNQFDKRGFLSYISTDQEAILIHEMLETRKNNFNVKMIVSFSSWPNTLSLYCEIIELDEEILQWFKLKLGYGSFLVFEGNQSVEFVGNKLGAATFLFVKESYLENDGIFKTLENLFGFVEYHLDFIEQENKRDSA